MRGKGFRPDPLDHTHHEAESYVDLSLLADIETREARLENRIARALQASRLIRNRQTQKLIPLGVHAPCPVPAARQPPPLQSAGSTARM